MTMYNVYVALMKRGEFVTFKEAFKCFFEVVQKKISGKDALSLEALETACWIEADVASFSLYFYCCKNLAHAIGLLNEHGELQEDYESGMTEELVRAIFIEFFARNGEINCLFSPQDIRTKIIANYR